MPDTYDAGVVDQYIDFVEALADLFDQPLHALAITYIAYKIEDLGSKLLKLRASAREFLLFARTNHDARAFSGKFFRQCKPKSARATGYEHHLSLQVVLATGATQRTYSNHGAGSADQQSCSYSCGSERCRNFEGFQVYAVHIGILPAQVSQPSPLLVRFRTVRL